MMGGWLNGWMVGWTDGWMDGWFSVCLSVWMDAFTCLFIQFSISSIQTLACLSTANEALSNECGELRQGCEEKMAPSLHHHCTIAAPSRVSNRHCTASLHHHCTPSLRGVAEDYGGHGAREWEVPALHHHCTSTAPALHQHCTGTAPSLHRHCIITVDGA